MIRLALTLGLLVVAILVGSAVAVSILHGAGISLGPLSANLSQVLGNTTAPKPNSADDAESITAVVLNTAAPPTSTPSPTLTPTPESYYPTVTPVPTLSSAELESQAAEAAEREHQKQMGNMVPTEGIMALRFEGRAATPGAKFNLITLGNRLRDMIALSHYSEKLDVQAACSMDPGIPSHLSSLQENGKDHHFVISVFADGPPQRAFIIQGGKPVSESLRRQLPKTEEEWKAWLEPCLP